MPVTQIKDSRDWALCKHRPRAIAISSPVAPLLSFDCLVPTQKGEFEGMQADFENDRVSRKSHKVQKMIWNIPSHVYQPVARHAHDMAVSVGSRSTQRQKEAPGMFAGASVPLKILCNSQVWATMTRGQIKLYKCLKEGHLGRSAYIFSVISWGGLCFQPGQMLAVSFPASPGCSLMPATVDNASRMACDKCILVILPN